MRADMSRFSSFGSDVFEDRMQRILEEIAEEFSDSIPAAASLTLILGGGYGRGEGGVFLVNDAERVYNDLDFFVFSPDLNPFKKSVIKSKLQHLHHTLSSRYGFDVDFSSPIPYSSLPKMRISLMLYDLLMGHKVISGNPHLLSALPKWQASDIPRSEGLRLLLNRAVGLYFARNKLLEEQSESNWDFIHRNIQKAYQALLEAILISEGRYQSSIKKRLSQLEDNDVTVYFTDPGVIDKIRAAYNFKQKPFIPDLSPVEISKQTEDAIDALKAVYYKLWSLELLRDIDNGDSLCAALRSRVVNINPKHIMQNFREFKSFRYSRILNNMHPRMRLHMCLPKILFQEEIISCAPSQILGLAANADTKQINDRFIAIWQRIN